MDPRLPPGPCWSCGVHKNNIYGLCPKCGLFGRAPWHPFIRWAVVNFVGREDLGVYAMGEAEARSVASQHIPTNVPFDVFMVQH